MPEKPPEHSANALADVIADLRRQHPRLLLIAGERHASAETRRLFASIAKDANVGFFEAPNQSGDPQGQTLTHQQRESHIARRERNIGATPTNRAYAQALCAPQYPVMVDTTEPPPEITAIRETIFRMYKNGTPSKDPAYAALREQFFDLSRQRLQASNQHMAENIANHLDAKFPGATPFFGVALMGDAHMTPLPQFATKDTKYDIEHTLKQRGYDTVTLAFEPTARSNPRMKPGDYVIGAPNNRPGIDYTVKIVDPPALSSARHIG